MAENQNKPDNNTSVSDNPGDSDSKLPYVTRNNLPRLKEAVPCDYCGKQYKYTGRFYDHLVKKHNLSDEDALKTVKKHLAAAPAAAAPAPPPAPAPSIMETEAIPQGLTMEEMIKESLGEDPLQQDVPELEPEPIAERNEAQVNFITALMFKAFTGATYALEQKWKRLTGWSDKMESHEEDYRGVLADVADDLGILDYTEDMTSYTKLGMLWLADGMAAASQNASQKSDKNKDEPAPVPREEPEQKSQYDTELEKLLN
jgi:hypothetical protein